MTTSLGAADPVSDTAPADRRAVLAPYLPRLVVDWVAETPRLRHKEVEGTLAFVDISGFTRLSEALAKHGKIGAEELAATIGECFAPLLDFAYFYGGRLLKFGGDALLLLFSGPDHEARACRAAFEMRRALRVVGRLSLLGHRVTLRMSVGVNSGVFDMFLVGASHRELVVAGPGVSATVDMESAATAGEILLSPSTASRLAPSDLGSSKQGGWLLRRAPSDISGRPTSHDPIGMGDDLSQCIPAAIATALLGASHEPEHRRVVVAFLHFDGTDGLRASAGPDGVVEYLETLVSDVQEAVDSQGITFLGSDIDHDGGKIILVGGTPSTSGDDEHRMLLALRQIVERPSTPTLRVGVARGPVFAGDIGPSYRRTFTVMGDTVNLSARLMAKATPGQILATPDVLERSRSEFAFAVVPPFTVKGKAKPVHAVDIGPRLGARAIGPADSSFVGRRQELETWRSHLERASMGSGSFIEVVGEPGVGKSRLVEEFLAAASGMVIASAGCEYYESSTPYGALRGLVRSLLGLPITNSPGIEERLSEAVAESAPELVPWVPLIGAVADVEVPATPETAELDPEFWGLRLRQVVTLLLSKLLPSPTVLIVEDCHWMDEASTELLRHLAEGVATQPWVLCCTRRDVESGFVAPDDVSTSLRLEPLAEADATELVQAAALDAPFTAHEAAVLAERSGGNPLFLRELVAAARRSTRHRLTARLGRGRDRSPHRPVVVR